MVATSFSDRSILGQMRVVGLSNAWTWIHVSACYLSELSVSIQVFSKIVSNVTITESIF